MKTILFFILLSISISSLCQNTLLNENVLFLGEKHFDHPISIEIKPDIGNNDECQYYKGNGFKQPHLLLIEKAVFDSLNNYSELTIFNKDCYLYKWYFFPDFVREYIIPYMDTTSVLYQRINGSYSNWFVHPFMNLVNNSSKSDYGTFYTRNVAHHCFLIVLMNAKIYNEYLSHLSGNDSYYSGTCEENGIYYKVAVPIPEK